MYGQANYASQFGQGPQKPWPPAYQQRAVAPPPPPPPTSYIQPGPPIPSHPITQQAPAPPPQAGQPLHLSQLGSHVPPPPLCQGPSIQVLPGGIPNIRQTYFHTFPPVHGSTQVFQFNSSTQQNIQLSQSGVQNMHHILPPPPRLPPPPPPPPPHASNPDLLRPPQPSTVVPVHPPSQGQTLYGARVHPPLQQGGLLVFPSIPQQPTTSNFPTPPYGEVMQSNLGESHFPPMAPPPPPSSPPPIPPSPPPPMSPSFYSIPSSDSSNLLRQSEFDPSSTINSSKELKAFESNQGGTPPRHLGDDGPKHDEHRNFGGGMVSKVENEKLSDKGNVQDLPPPPRKPKDDKVVRKIEVLCKFIANNGSSFEDTTRRKEFGNPEFEFLNGGVPGSEAAIGHEYFLWMKKKYSMDCKNKEMKEKSPVRSLRIGPQSEYLTVSAASISPANSDMEMEDDITPADVEEETSHSFEIQSYEYKSRKEEHDAKDQLQGPEDLQRSSPEEEVAEDGGPKLLVDHEKSVSVAACQVHSPVIITAGVAEQPLGSNFEISVTCLQNDKSLAVSEAFNSSQSTALFAGGSPFRLIQDYSSDENSENDEELQLKDVSFAISPSTPASSKTSEKDTGNLTILGSKGSFQVQRSNAPPCEASVPDSGTHFLSESPKQVFDDNEVNVRETGNEQSYRNQQNQIGSGTSYKSLDAIKGCSVDVLHDSDKLQKENDEEKLKFGSSPVKIDEFGRLVREGGSDSDSDDSHYTRRHKKRRTRNSSESRSPVDRRRGRRSPWRRRQRRSRSRSWSPRNQRGRSRSRSPVSRRTSQFNNENMRRDKGMIRKCFDFQRGRCYRGAACRYVHHEPSKNDGSRLRRSKHHDVHPTSENIKGREDTVNTSKEVLDVGHIKVENQECIQHNVSPKDDAHDWKTGSPTGDPDSDVTKCQNSRDRAGLVHEELVYSKPAGAVHIHVNENCQEAEKSYEQLSVTAASQCMSNAETEKLSGDISMSMMTSVEKPVAQQSNMFVAELQAANSVSHQMDGSFVPNLLPDQVTVASTNKAPECEQFPDKTSSIKPQFDTTSASLPPLTSQFVLQSPVPKSFSATAPGCDMDDAHPLRELPPPPPLLTSRVTSAEVPMPTPYNFVSQNVSFPSKPSLPGAFHPHQDFVSIQSSHYHSTSFPPSRPLYDSTLAPITIQDGTPMQFHQSHLSRGSDLGSQSVMKSQPLELNSHSKLGESPVREPYRAPLHMDEIRSIAPVANNRPSQPFGFPSFQKEENFGRTSVEMSSSSFFPHRNFNDQSMPFTNASRMQSSGDNFPPTEFQSSFSQFHSYSRFQQPLYASQPAHDSLLRGSTQIGIRHYPDPISRNHSSLLPDFGGLGITTYHNPYASTFEKPLSSNFRSNILNFGNDAPSGDIRDSTFNLSNVRVDEQGANYVGSRLTTTSPKSTKPLGKLLPSPGGDQYDPLFDSIEPSPPRIKKPDRGRKLEKARESHMMTRLGGSHKLLDVEENNKHKEVAAVASTTSMENDEFGETADAEAGAVENDLDDEVNLSGEIEIDQVKSSEKSKKAKGSRSLRLFRIAIADFVKEVLKPSWRQGNMSKEAFKTIVKKTVDKVSGAMKSHQIPKSQAKINRYIDSSQRKLTKLVMGYVDKYVKT